MLRSPIKALISFYKPMLTRSTSYSSSSDMLKRKQSYNGKIQCQICQEIINNIMKNPLLINRRLCRLRSGVVELIAVGACGRRRVSWPLRGLLVRRRVRPSGGDLLWHILVIFIDWVGVEDLLGGRLILLGGRLVLLRGLGERASVIHHVVWRVAWK